MDPLRNPCHTLVIPTTNHVGTGAPACPAAAICAAAALFANLLFRGDPFNLVIFNLVILSEAKDLLFLTLHPCHPGRRKNLFFLCALRADLCVLCVLRPVLAFGEPALSEAEGRFKIFFAFAIKCFFSQLGTPKQKARPQARLTHDSVFFSL